MKEKSLPRELWIIILEIKWWTARKKRIEEKLRFPKLLSYNETFRLEVYGVWCHRWGYWGGSRNETGRWMTFKQLECKDPWQAHYS